MKMLTLFVIASMGGLMTQCGNTMGPATATIDEICRQNGEALPTRSVEDTQQTRDEITEAYATFALTCPDWAHLIP